jgi:hypothetical protein
MEVDLDDEDMKGLSDAMWTIFMILPDKLKDEFVGMIMDSYELYTLDQACEALNDAKHI